MCRYSDSAVALDAALALMVAEGDTLIAAAIAHPLALAKSRIGAPPMGDDGFTAPAGAAPTDTRSLGTMP